ncbi:MAG: metalloprotease PmbA [Xanthomonadales bacterium]|jgi:PmbA protein|nr:metalloprotease PmbA [Xanthomonadales bacterium]
MNTQHNPEAGLPDREAEAQALEVRVAEALDLARRGGAEQAEVTASLQGGLNVTARLGEVETIEHTRDRGLSVTVYIKQAKGHASSADLSDASLRNSVERALDIARYTAADSCNGLADPERMATLFPDLDLWHPSVLDADAAIERALRMEDRGRAATGITNSEGASVSSSFGVSVYGNSHGFLGRSDGTRFGQSCVLIAGEGGGMQRDYWYDSSRAFEDLEAPESTGEKAAERTLRRIGARKVATGKFPVLFAPEIARSILGHLVGGVSGGALYRNASFLKDTLGERLFPEGIDIVERPLLPRGPGSTAFDGEGVAVSDRALVEGGVLQSYVLSSYSARRLGLETTGNAGGVHNLFIEGKAPPAADLVGQLGTGLLVTEVMGQGVRMVTGDYSRGAAGFWVNNGVVEHPVEEVTIAGNLRDMFRGIAAVGDDVDRRGNLQCGSLLIEGMTVAGS